MTDNVMTDAQLAELKKKRTFKKYTYRGVDLDQLLDMPQEKVRSCDFSWFPLSCALCRSWSCCRVASVAD